MTAQVLQLHPDRPRLTLAQALDAFESHLEEAELRPNTQDAYRHAVRKYAAFLERFPGAEQAFEDKSGAEHAVREWRDEQLEVRRFAASTVNLSLAAIKLLYQAAMFIDIKVKSPKVPRPGAPKALDRKDEARLRHLVDKLAESGEWKDVRNAALIYLLLDTGARIDECHRLELPDVPLARRNAKVRLYGKGGKVRQIKINQNLRDRLLRWLRLRAELEKAEGSTKLWISQKGPMSYGGLKTLVRSFGPMAKIESLSPHDLRHTFGTRLRQAGVDLAVIAELMGHESVTTTMRYTRPGEQEKDDIIDKVFG